MHQRLWHSRVLRSAAENFCWFNKRSESFGCGTNPNCETIDYLVTATFVRDSAWEVLLLSDSMARIKLMFCYSGLKPGEALTSLQFDDSGLRLAVGTSNGLVSLFDLRSQSPLVTKDHMYNSPIVDIKFCSGDLGGTKSVMSSDRHIVKVWDSAAGKSLLNVEPGNGLINDVCLWKGAGLIMVATEESKIQVSSFTQYVSQQSCSLETKQT